LVFHFCFHLLLPANVGVIECCFGHTPLYGHISHLRLHLKSYSCVICFIFVFHDACMGLTSGLLSPVAETIWISFLIRKSSESLRFFALYLAWNKGISKISRGILMSLFCFGDLAKKCSSLHGLRLGLLLGIREQIGRFEERAPSEGYARAERFFLVLLLERRLFVSSYHFELLF